MLTEMFELLGGSVAIFAATSPGNFMLACLGALILACSLWWLCSVYTRLWNTAFHMNLTHHFLCALGAICTIFIVISFASVHVVGEAIDKEIARWVTQMDDSLRSSQGDIPASSGSEDAPEIPATNAALLDNFKSGHPFLKNILSSATIDPAEDHGSVKQMPADNVSMVASSIAEVLSEHLGSTLFRLQAFLLFLFVLIYAVPFGLTGYLAHRDIRPAY